MLSHKEPDKAQHYLDLLDTTRCNGQWQEVPECVRKVTKHAPLRQCLTLTAQTEFRVASNPSNSSQRPSTSSSTVKTASQLVAPLENGVSKEKRNPEDVFQGQICLAWLHSTLGEWEDALRKLPPDLEKASDRMVKEGGIRSRWTHVCIVKGAYIRGLSLEKLGNVREAVLNYAPMLPYLSRVPSTFSATPEHRLWAERLVARACMLSANMVSKNALNSRSFVNSSSSSETGSILAPFRAWADLWNEKRVTLTGGSGGKPGENGISVARVWKAYYDALSILTQLQIGKPVFDSKSAQSSELKHVETTYEGILLKDINFPKANEASTEIESWVDQVMANWRAMCGPNWQETDYGSGGKALLGKGILDILYRAATRSFHSTRVLRHLFTVHASLAEFYLAGKALDTYFEIVAKGKARVEKSGEAEINLDDDATVLCTAAAGIKMLSHYGKRKEAERALELSDITETWLRKILPVNQESETSAEDVPKDLVEKKTSATPSVSGRAIALGLQSIGISKARWARLTYQPSSRPDLQGKAISHLREALDPRLGDEDNVETLFSLAYTLAETRDIDAAIKVVKQAISVSTSDSADHTLSQINGNGGSHSDVDTHQRGLLLRCWHLLVLLLGASQNFSTALASCEASFEPYGGKAVLFGDFRQVNSIKALRYSEKHSMLEMKMTQLTLSEILDGPEEAVNASGELLGLFTKVFNYTEQAVTAPLILQPRPTSPSTSATSAHKSFRGSILGPQNSRRSRLFSGGKASASVGSLEPPKTAISETPGIAITSDINPLPQESNHHNHFVGRHETNKLHKRNSRKSMRRSRASSPTKSPSKNGQRSANLALPAQNHNEDGFETDGQSSPNGVSYNSDDVGVAITHDLPSMPSSPAANNDPPNPLHNISSTTDNMDKKNPNSNPVPSKPQSWPKSHLQPITLSTSNILLEPHYNPADQTRHSLTLLTKIWLFIASLYRRASMPTDAQGAISEATTHAQTIENNMASQEGNSAQKFSSPGYGGLKSCGELWADVLAEQAALHTSLGNLAEASGAYETAVANCPDHPAATVGLCNILLDSYDQPSPSPSQPQTQDINTNKDAKPTPTLITLPTPESFRPKNEMPTATPELLARLAARDRAYGLLSALTKSGQGWDCSEAWFALARAYEESGQVEKAKEALWWVVELEDGRGLRGWECVL